MEGEWGKGGGEGRGGVEWDRRDRGGREGAREGRLQTASVRSGYRRKGKYGFRCILSLFSIL